MRFLIDMPLSPRLGTWLAQMGHDAIHAVSRGLETAADIDVMSVAREERRIVVTADLHYPRLLMLLKAPEPPLILLRGGNYTDQEAMMLVSKVLKAVPEGELETSVVVVDRTTIRRRRLPLTE